MATIESLDYESDRLIAEVKLILKLKTYSIILGILLSIFGYIQWYYKIQKYQDKVLKNSAKKQMA